MQLLQIPAYKPKLEEARQSQFEGKYPTVFVPDLLGQAEQFFAALDVLPVGAVAQMPSPVAEVIVDVSELNP